MITVASHHIEKLAQELERIAPGAVRTNVSLAAISQWRVGGIAKVVVSPRSVSELVQLRAWLTRHAVGSVVVGASSNLLFSDDGLDVVVIHIGEAFSAVTVDGEVVAAGAGAWVPGLSRLALRHGLSGLEHACGIPGTLGGLIYMNGGSQRKGIGSSVIDVHSVAADGRLVTRRASECGFAYRTSLFQELDEVIIGATLRLTRSEDVRASRREVLGILRDRRRKFPRKQPNCGSVFVSDPAMYEEYGPPGKVIEHLGLKGFRVGGALVSPLHANFIVNDTHQVTPATAKDILAVIEHVASRVAQQTGYVMKVEVRYVDVDGEIRVIAPVVSDHNQS